VPRVRIGLIEETPEEHRAQVSKFVFVYRTLVTVLSAITTIVALATASTWGRPAETEHLRVWLVSDTDSLQPGKPLLVGLQFTMQKQWHIYWRNPGDSGEPPRVRWHLPTGFQAGELEWPAPTRLGSGSVIDYGYEEPVLLPLEMKTPGSLVIGRNVPLSADVSWLVCKEICVPGRANLTLALPVRATLGSESASHALFQEARSRMPKPMPPSWSAYVASKKDWFVLTVHGAGAAKASFFPFEADQIDNAAPQSMAALPGGLELMLKKSDQLLKTPALLNGVLELSSGRAYVMSAPVRSLH
jgi:DsbC/DsbD-like thiol-disulfide interchange protein